MKVSTSLFFDRSTNQMIKGQSELAKTQTKLSSGKEVVNPSDAPEKATAIQRIKSVLNNIYKKNYDEIIIIPLYPQYASASTGSSGITTAPSNVVLTWDVVNQGASAYRFTGPGQDPTANNPDIYLSLIHI